MADEKTETTELAKKPEQKPPMTIAVDESSFSSYLDTAKFNQLWRVANVFAGSDIVPEHYRQKPNNCFLALQMATRLEVEPLMFMQNSYIVHGRPGMESKMVIALVNSRGPFTGPIQWRFEGSGKDKKCIAYTTHKITGEVCEATVSWAMVEAEGWNKDKPMKTGGVQKSKWNTLTDLMFQYRSASFLAKLYCPEVLMGMVMKEELEDIVDESGNQVPSRPVSSLEDKLSKKVNSTVKPTHPGIPLAEAEAHAADIFRDQNPTDAQNDAEVETFAEKVKPEPENPSQDASGTTSAGPANIPASERYFCPACDDTFGKAKGLNNTICPNPKCGKLGIVDRWNKQ